MPIYAYRCDHCGVEKDVLQKLSDAPLTVCPDCGAEAFHKRLSAPAFQLKGSGWYVTDFRDGGRKAEAQAGSGDGSRDSGSDSKQAGQDKSDQGKTGQDKTGQDKAGQDKAGQDKAGQDKAGQDKAGQVAAGSGTTAASATAPASGASQG